MAAVATSEPEQVESPSNALVPTSNELVDNNQHDQEQEREREFLKQAEENEANIRELQFQLGRIEDMRRAAVKETTLVREIRSINALTQRKVDAQSEKQQQESGELVEVRSPPAKRKNQLPLTEETRQEITLLEDAMFNETRRTSQLTEESELVTSQVEKLEKEIAHVDGHLTVAEKATGRARTGGTNYHEANLENVIGRLKTSLAKLDEEQRTTFSTTSRLTKQIDELGAELEAMAEVDELLVEAKDTLATKTREHELLGEDLNRQTRIWQKKEKAITSFSMEKDISEFKKLETEKKMLHVQLQKEHDNRRISARAVEVNAVALRRLEAQLGGVSQALSLVFAQSNPDVPDDQRASAHAVPIQQFEEVQDSLDDCRKSISIKDKQLDQIDAEVEALERKVDIFQVAQQSKQSTAYLGFRQMLKERDELHSHLQQTEVEFTGARQRLAQENEMLERHTNSKN